MVRQALLDKTSLIPLGSGSRWRSRSGSESPRLRSTRLCSVLEHDHVNQVVTVQAGAPLARLQEILAERRQWLPIRPPLSGQCTVGGVAALNACGPDRLRYGAPRDLLLGLRFVCGTGRLVNGGGRVVKNVAGYDMTRLLCGSAGALGMLTELTFRTFPLPERCAALESRGAWDGCALAASRLLDSPIEPAFIAAAADACSQFDGGWRLLVGYEGFAETVDDQLERSERLFEQSGLRSCSRRDYAAGEDLFAAEFLRFHSAEVLWRADVPLGRVEELGRLAIRFTPDASLLADMGCGRIHAAMSELPDDAWRAIRQATDQMRGHAVLERWPASSEDRLDVAAWRHSQPALIRRLKDELDPGRVFPD
jgi:FAD/FMN-containing dehydrogenase